MQSTFPDKEYIDEQYFGELHESLNKVLKDKPSIQRITGTQNRFYFTKAGPKAPVFIYNSGTTLIDNFYDKAGTIAINKWKVNLYIQMK